MVFNQASGGVDEGAVILITAAKLLIRAGESPRRTRDAEFAVDRS